MVRLTWRGVGGALAVLIVLAGCSGGGGKAAVKSSSATESASPSSSTSDTIVPGKTTFGPNDDDAIIQKAVDDVQSFYEEMFPKLYGQPFRPLSGGTFPYGPANPPPACGATGKIDYRDVAQNAFYCPLGDFM